MAKRKTPPRDPKTGRFKSRKRTRATSSTKKRKPRKRTSSTRARRPRRNPTAIHYNKRDTLEAEWVDKYGLTGVLFGLAEICYEKAEHLRSNWQDMHTARLWQQMGDKMDAAAIQAEKRGV